MAQRYTNDEMIADIRRVADLTGGALGPAVYSRLGAISLNTVRNRFGSWKAAAAETGIETPAIVPGGKWGTCVVCGGQYQSVWKSRTCRRANCITELKSRAGFKGDAASPTAARMRARKLYPLTHCNRCGGAERLQRHHRDRNPYNNTPENVEILSELYT